MLGFDALAKLPLAASSVAVSSGLSVTQDPNTISATGTVRTVLGLSVTQGDQTLSATGTVTLSEAPCVLRAVVEVHVIVAVASYTKLSAAVSYSAIKYRTCWDVVADREAA